MHVSFHDWYQVVSNLQFTRLQRLVGKLVTGGLMHYIFTYIFQCCLIFRQALIMLVPFEVMHQNHQFQRGMICFSYLHIPLNQCSMIFRQAMDFNTGAVTRQGDAATTMGEVWLRWINSIYTNNTFRFQASRSLLANLAALMMQRWTKRTANLPEPLRGIVSGICGTQYRLQLFIWDDNDVVFIASAWHWLGCWYAAHCGLQIGSVLIYCVEISFTSGDGWLVPLTLC